MTVSMGGIQDVSIGRRSFDRGGLSVFWDEEAVFQDDPSVVYLDELARRLDGGARAGTGSKLPVAPHGGSSIEKLACSSDVVRQLREKLDRYHHRRALEAGWRRRFVPTGITRLDGALPHGGLPCGAVTEILCDTPGVGAMTLAMRWAATEVRSAKFEERYEATKRRSDEGIGTRSGSGGAYARDEETESGSQERSSLIPHSAFRIRHSGDGRVLMLIDTRGDFYPPAAVDLGVPLDQLVVVHPRNEREAFWAADQALRCTGVGAVLASLTALDDRSARRLQLAAESSGCLGILLRPVRAATYRFAAVHCFAAVQMRIEGSPPSADRPDHRRFRLTLLTVREGSPAEPFLVDLDHETGAGDLSALSADRPAARTG